jgi:hypothetical protein
MEAITEFNKQTVTQIREALLAALGSVFSGSGLVLSQPECVFDCTSFKASIILSLSPENMIRALRKVYSPTTQLEHMRSGRGTPGTRFVCYGRPESEVYFIIRARGPKNYIAQRMVNGKPCIVPFTSVKQIIN